MKLQQLLMCWSLAGMTTLGEEQPMWGKAALGDESSHHIDKLLPEEKGIPACVTLMVPLKAGTSPACPVKLYTSAEVGSPVSRERRMPTKCTAQGSSITTCNIADDGVSHLLSEIARCCVHVMRCEAAQTHLEAC